MKRKFKRQKGQAVVEYIIIIVIVAIASLAVLSAFSGRLRNLIGGVTTTLGGEAEKVDSDQSLKDLQAIDPE